MRFLLIITLLIVLSLHVRAQKDPMKFGDIPMEDLKMTCYDKDSSAAAVVLADFGKVSSTDRYSMLYERHVRIKILKQEGTRWADEAVRLPYGGTRAENRFQLKASTFNLENGKIIETELPKESMFREKVVAGFELQKFTFPNVKVGSVLEYSYSVVALGVPSWEFQKTIPIRVSEYWANIPAGLRFGHFTYGYIQATTYEVKNSAAENSYHWIYRDVPAFKREPFMNSEGDYMGKLQFYLTEINVGYPIELGGTWEKINELLYKSEYLCGHIAGNPFLKNITKELIDGKTSPMEKVSSIYNYVKNKYTLEKYNAVGSRNLKEAFDKGVGTASDINLTLASMLNKAGFEVNAVLISTRENGFVRKQVATQYQFNYLICAVRIGDRIILLDATEKHLPLGFLPERCLNGEGFLVHKEKYVWIPTDFFPLSKTVTSGELTLDEGGNIQGKIAFTRDGYDAFDFRKSYSEKGAEEFKKDFLHKMGWEAEHHEVQNIEDLTMSAKEIYSIRIENHASGTDDILYVNPILYDRITENPFTASERKYPISYPKTFESVFMSRITLPQGYEVDEIPGPLVIKLPDNSAKYTYSVTQNGNVLSVISHFKIGKPVFIQNEYLQLKEFYSQVVAKQAEQIVLKRK